MNTCYIVVYNNGNGDEPILEHVFSTLRKAESYILSEIQDGYGSKVGAKCYLSRGNKDVREYWAAEEEADIGHQHYIVTEKVIDEWKE